MTTIEIKSIEDAWACLAPLVFVPHNEQEYEHLVSILDTLVDLVGNDEMHAFTSLIEVIGALIENYEDNHVPELN